MIGAIVDIHEIVGNPKEELISSISSFQESWLCGSMDLRLGRSLDDYTVEVIHVMS